MSEKPSNEFLVQELKKKEAYPHQVNGDVRVQETSISWIFLTGRHAYKVKKAVRWGGVADYSTLEKRKFFCEKEFALNSTGLCAGMYEAVLPITRNTEGAIRIGGEGEAVDYSIKMLEFPQSDLLTHRIFMNDKSIDTGMADKLAKIVAEFHYRAPKVDARYGSVEWWKKRIEEDMEATKQFTEPDQELFNKLVSWLEKNKELLDKRIRQNKIRDCHGDLHPGNIFVSGIRPNQKIFVFDRIDFCDELRYGDTVMDIGFLTSDLEFRNRRDLSEHFTKKYVEYSADAAMLPLLPFYKAYSAQVRSKISGIKAEEQKNGKEKAFRKEVSQKFRELAKTYL
jgi:hypothetical protein